MLEPSYGVEKFLDGASIITGARNDE